MSIEELRRRRVAEIDAAVERVNKCCVCGEPSTWVGASPDRIAGFCDRHRPVWEKA